MKIYPVIQRGRQPVEGTIKACLQSRLATGKFDHLQVAAAYVTVAGVRTLLGLCSNFRQIQNQWLVGLDDYVTQPGAIDLLRGLNRSELRVASLGASRFRFHPKVCRFRSSSKRGDLVVVGSANITNSALAGNSEAVVLLESESTADRSLGEDVWRQLWSQGHVPTAAELASYRKQYEQAKPLRQKIQALQGPRDQAAGRRTDPVIERDVAELDPERAQICWIECGSITAMGRELEFKAEQGLFFGLDPTVENEGYFTFDVSDGANVRLRIKYQENHMWRLQMNNEVPEVERGLRPRIAGGRLGRSEYVAVFTRTKKADDYELKFVHLNSPEFAALLNQSQRLGTVGHTTTTSSGRVYGWC